ncbi:indole-3-glycerol phosphate synthase TrpC [Corynebacterium sp. ES2794-CONJ1]|uniref:indole-3-glycerol phosphate synthase TrpC n=1 Tax=unclassified Corynebacterium TaxID=2624378 RepID=UPI0021679D63|nr:MULTISPECIES: indole-3-glycerol phosphate synthase TrpC [unclassified Corynebacterium]MCS4489053.1 indole-3-glycerol phosphate synthase TrpC [Corynebacterium sp. ES2775-CONJ]MCS4490866.1 indole-3-glycerol phosphate synthase TrpC [Corynebacterium sp. ES2715-CONJ3]MCS4531251.1 indole-3-glycerol phosphate synthase TrpC [Corynebacterium sp. ES2730-CONJ]MCU9518620.1 indole-3-glycerol phosphate synthase TrpC [Corynebacterium sp. ES2794-CONJ1]
MASVLESIIAGVREDVRAREAVMSFQQMKQRSRLHAPDIRPVRPLFEQRGCRLIAEIKRAAPTVGEIAHIDSAVDLAQQFERGGAAIIACHTERRQFHGSLEEMAEVRKAVATPIMCRDFIIDPYQIHEARYYGADMVPLRVAALDQPHLAALIDRVESLGMAALVEVRNPQEASRALAAGASIIGVNARDFETMTLNRRAFGDIAPGLPHSIIKIALSGVRTAAELLDYAASGADAVVMGQSLVTADSPQEFTKKLVSVGLHPSCPGRG